jgi:predicted Zn-dependent peptidase
MVRINLSKDYNLQDEHDEYALSNGLRIIFHPSTSNITTCGFVINAGTRDEGPDESGMAHFIEHLLFKGTEKRKSIHILNRLSNVGGDIDAFTCKEDTTVYATVLNKDFERALEVLSDIVFHSTFPEKEIAHETEVIVGEIQAYEDTPTELIFDEFENIIYKGHPLGRNILGNADAIRQFDTAKALDFTRRYYQPDNMVFFVTGNLSFKTITRLVQKYTGDIQNTVIERRRDTPSSYEPKYIEEKRDTHQAHVVIGCQAYRSFHPKSAGLYLLSNVVGGTASNNRLSMALRERLGLVYTIESYMTGYTDTGHFCIYFGCDPKDVDRCLSLTMKELKKLRDVRLTPRQLSIAKKQLISQIIIGNENDESNALDMGKTYLHHHIYDTLQEACERILALTSDQLLDIANENFAEDNLTTLIYR